MKRIALLALTLSVAAVAQQPVQKPSQVQAAQPSAEELVPLQLAIKDQQIAAMSMELAVEHILAKHPDWRFDQQAGRFYVSPAATPAPAPNPLTHPAIKN